MRAESLSLLIESLGSELASLTAAHASINFGDSLFPYALSSETVTLVNLLDLLLISDVGTDFDAYLRPLLSAALMS